MASELRVNTINSRTGFGTITVSETGQDLVGITTIENLTAENTLVGAAASFTGNVSVGGVLTYEDVTNIDSVGLITARQGIEIGARPGVAASISVDGNAVFSGITTFGSDISVAQDITFVRHMTLADKIIHNGDTDTMIRFPAVDTFSVETSGTEAFRVTSDGNISVNDTGNTNYTTFSPCLVIGDSGDSTPGLVLRGSTSSNCDISFCDNSGAESDDGVSEGLIRYEHSNDAMRFDTADSERLRITSGGVLNVPAGIGPQLRFENQHSVTTDATISTFDDADGTLLSLGSNFYFDSSGSETRYNTSEESSGIVLNRNGKITLKTGGTGATATTRLELDSVGSALFTNGIQIGVDEGSSTSGGLLIHRYSSTSIDDGVDFNLVITWPHSNIGAFMVECFSGHSHYQGNIMYYKLVGNYGAHGANGGVTTTVIQETNANTVSVSNSSDSSQRGAGSDYSVTITARSGQSNSGTSIDSHVHVYVHSRVAPTSVTIG